MERCVNLRQTAEGYEDPITFEPLQPEEVISFERRGRFHCYHALSLLRSHHSRQQLRAEQGYPPDGKFLLPESRQPLRAEEVALVYERARSEVFFPQLYHVKLHGEFLPYTFTTEEKARDYVNQRRTGHVFRFAQADDPELYDLLYPTDQPVIPVYGIRGQLWPAGDDNWGDDADAEADLPLRSLVRERPVSPTNPELYDLLYPADIRSRAGVRERPVSPDEPFAIRRGDFPSPEASPEAPSPARSLFARRRQRRLAGEDSEDEEDYRTPPRRR